MDRNLVSGRRLLPWLIAGVAAIAVIAFLGLRSSDDEQQPMQAQPVPEQSVPPGVVAKDSPPAAVSVAEPAQADALDGLLGERILGNPDAPVTIYEYSSLTCPHCATFHAETLPKIVAEYIDTGKARLVFRDFPFDRVGLMAATVARCVEPSRYFGFLDVLFKGQMTWATDKDPVAAVSKLARFAGLNDAKVAECLDNKELADAIIERRIEGERKYQINSTPSFVIVGKSETKVAGAQPFAAFEAAIEAAAK